MNPIWREALLMKLEKNSRFDLVKAEESQISTEEILTEFTDIGRKHFGEKFTQMVEPLREALSKGELQPWIALSKGVPVGMMICTGREDNGRIIFIHVLSEYEKEGIVELLIKKGVEELKGKGMRRITAELLFLSSKEQGEKTFSELGFSTIKRWLMSLTVQKKIEEPHPPPGYDIVLWDDQYLEGCTQVIHDANKGSLDLLIYPAFRTLEGTNHMVRGIRAGQFSEGVSCIALFNDSPCGTVLVTHPSPHDGFIAEMAVARAHQGKGVGTALLGKALSAGYDQGMTAFRLGVTEDNTAAVALYQKFGFILDEQFTVYIWENE